MYLTRLATGLVVTLLVFVTLPSVGVAQAPRSRIVIAQGLDPTTLDPHGATQQAILNVSMQIAEALTDVDYKSNKVVPELATAWRSVDDTTWEFKLREGVRFTNGEPFDAEVVKWNIERLLNPPAFFTTSAGFIYLSGVLKEARVVDRSTIRLVTEQPYPMLPLVMSKIPLIPPAYVRQIGDRDFGRRPIGTGPYKFVEWVRDDHVTLAANESYWGGKVAIDEVVFRSIPEEAARLAALQAGEVDLIALVPIANARAISGNPRLQLVEIPSLRNMLILFNTLEKGPIQNRLVRQALNYAIDKQSLVKAVLEGHGKVLNGQILSEYYFGYNPDLEPYPYDPQKARSLLASAGYPRGLTLDFASPQGRYMADRTIAEFIAAELAKVGVTARLRVHEWSTYTGLFGTGRLTTLSLYGWATVPDADTILSLYLSDRRGSYWRNLDFDRTLLRARSSLDLTERLRLYKRATQIQYDNPPHIFLHQQYDLYAVNRRVNGWVARPDEKIVLKGVSVVGR